MKFELLKKSSEKEVKRFSFLLEGVKKDIIMKSYQPNHLWGKIKDLFRTCWAQRSWVAANALTKRKISTVKPLSCMVEKRWGRVVKSYFFYEYVSNATVLTFFLRDAFHSPLNSAERRLKRKLIVQCAHFVKNLHQRSIYHGDLKASNILVQQKETGDFKFFLVDLDYVKVCCLNTYQRYRNLMQLNKSFLDRQILSMTDRLTFLHAYLGFSCRNKRKVRRDWKIISYLTSRRLRKTDRTFQLGV